MLKIAQDVAVVEPVKSRSKIIGTIAGKAVSPTPTGFKIDGKLVNKPTQFISVLNELTAGERRHLRLLLIRNHVKNAKHFASLRKAA